MADLSCSRTNRKCSSFATKHFQRKSFKIFDLHPPLRRLVSFVTRIFIWKVRCWVTDTHIDTQTHRPRTVTLAAHAHRGLITTSCKKYVIELVFIQTLHSMNTQYNSSCSSIIYDFLNLITWAQHASLLEVIQLHKPICMGYSAHTTSSSTICLAQQWQHWLLTILMLLGTILVPNVTLIFSFRSVFIWWERNRAGGTTNWKLP